jgi:GNAT superfamily N-acetyltransferase
MTTIVSNQITTDQIQQDPSRIATTVHHASIGEIALRPLVAKDAQIVGTYFCGLSEDTRRRYAPHKFDQETADAICANVDYADTIRMLATLPPPAGTPGGQEQVIAYFILQLGVRDGDRDRYQRLGIALDSETDCVLAPSVADAFQDRGVGSLVMAHVIAVARRLGRKRLVLMGGVRGMNDRAIHFYKKHGFCTVGTFDWPAGFLNYDMILDLWE